VVLGLGLLLVAACAGIPERGPRGHLELDSATSACRQRPELCAHLAGEQAVVPIARSLKVVASTIRAATGAVRVLEATAAAVIEQKLVRCADEARSKVLAERLNGRSPTVPECNSLVEDGPGRRITLAMQLGCAMHEVALRCAREDLNKLRPGGFSLEQRYRYTRDSRKLEVVSENEARALLRQGCGDELVGTLVPDVVIHEGDPLEVLAIYDFKFPCASRDPTPWRVYPEGHPHAGQSQRRMYEEALGAEARRVLPRWGILR
jgi:hypothetical protein